nr:zinc finger, CCHC-type [Tanacetum cinerariifolium]
MRDANPIRTLGDYSKPSHEGYMNTIEFSVGNNMVPLRSDTIRLVHNERSFYELRFEDPNQHLKDFLNLVDSLDPDVVNRERTCLCLFQFSLRDQGRHWLERLLVGSIATWEDLTTCLLAQFFPPGKTAKLCNVPTTSKRISLRIMDWGRGRKGVFRVKSNEMYQLPPEPSRQEEFEHIVTNFILDQEERVKQLEEYMRMIVGDFMQLSLKVTRRLKRKIIEEGSRIRKIKKITKYLDIEAPKPFVSIRDGRFNVRNTKVASIGNPRVKLAHRCIATTISGRKESTHRVTEIDLYYLYCIYKEGVVCNIPYWLAKYLKRVRQARWIDQQDECWEQFDAWRGQQEAQANLMYDHTVREFQYLSTRDTLEPYLPINPFHGHEADYTSYGYHGYMPPGYAYRHGPSHDGSS